MLHTTSTNLQACLDRIQQELTSGLRHGFFEMTVRVETIKGQKRAVSVHSGKSHQFVIPLEEIPSSRQDAERFPSGSVCVGGRESTKGLKSNPGFDRICREMGFGQPHKSPAATDRAI